MADFVEEIEHFLASFSPEETAVMRHAFRAILDGTPAKVAELPAAMGLPPSVVEAAVGRLVERGILVVEPKTGQITGARGISLTETAHRLTLDGRERYAFCAVDAVGIQAALGGNARVESHCYHCRKPIAVEFRTGTVAEATEGTVIWAVERDLSRSLRAHT